MILYSKPMPNVQRWMKRLAQKGYLRRVKRQVERIPGRRPKGDTGYRLVASKIVEEMDRTLRHNTGSSVAFPEDEKKLLVNLLDCDEAREFIAITDSTDLHKTEDCDICAKFSVLILGSIESSRLGKKPEDTTVSHIDAKYLDDPSILDALQKLLPAILEKISVLPFPSLLDPLARDQSAHPPSKDLAGLINDKEKLRIWLKFDSRLREFESAVSDTFPEKLRWSMHRETRNLFGLAKLLMAIPFVVKDFAASFSQPKMGREAS